MQTTSNLGEGGTRWRRFALPIIPAFGVLGLMLFLIMSGALAVSFSVSGIPFKLTANTLSGDGFVQYGSPDVVSNPGAAVLIPAPPTGSAAQTGLLDGKTHVADTITQIQSNVHIANLVQTVCVPLPTPANWTHHYMLVSTKAGNGAGGDVLASGLTVEAPQLNADSATFNNINIGQDLGNALGGADNQLFSQSATHVNITNVNQVGVATTATTFTLPNLQLFASFVDTCP